MRRRRGRPKVWLFPRLWIADRQDGAVRLSLPWHGAASWDDMHAYVTAVIKENYVPNAERAGWGGMTDHAQAERHARGILLSLCHRLSIEPVGAFDFHDPDYRVETAPDCPSCAHGLDIHADDGCMFTVVRGRLNRNAVCPCRVTFREIEESND